MQKPKLTLTHSDSTRERLMSFTRGTPEAFIGVKTIALLLILTGQRPGWVTEVLGITRQSLSQWIHKFNKEGLESLKPKPKTGRPPRIDLKTLIALEDDLKKSPQDFGIKRVRWNAPTLMLHLRRNFGIKIKTRQAHYWLHQLGYRVNLVRYPALPLRKNSSSRKLKNKPSKPRLSFQTSHVAIPTLLQKINHINTYS